MPLPRTRAHVCTRLCALAPHLRRHPPTHPPTRARCRFAAWKARESARHPLYATSAGEYGKVPRGVVVDLKPPTAGKGGGFSDTFLGGPFRDTGLNTTVSKSRFMKELDGSVV